MRTRLSAATVIAALLVLAACTPKMIVLTPEGKKVYTAIQISTRVDELQNAVIQANMATPPAISDQVAVTIVRFTVTAQKILAVTADGWQAQVRQAYQEMKKMLPPNVLSNPAIAAAFAGVDVILGVL